jgi:hypothetical protein
MTYSGPAIIDETPTAGIKGMEYYSALSGPEHELRYINNQSQDPMNDHASDSERPTEELSNERIAVRNSDRLENYDLPEAFDTGNSAQKQYLRDVEDSSFSDMFGSGQKNQLRANEYNTVAVMAKDDGSGSGMSEDDIIIRQIEPSSALNDKFSHLTSEVPPLDIDEQAMVRNRWSLFPFELVDDTRLSDDDSSGQNDYPTRNQTPTSENPREFQKRDSFDEASKSKQKAGNSIFPDNVNKILGVIEESDSRRSSSRNYNYETKGSNDLKNLDPQRLEHFAATSEFYHLPNGKTSQTSNKKAKKSNPGEPQHFALDLSPGRPIVDSDTRKLDQQNNLDFTEKFIFAHPAYKNLMLLEEKMLEIQSLKDKLVEQFNDDDEDDDFQQNVRYYLKELELERANLDERKFDVIEEIKTDLENANLIGDRNQIETHGLLFTDEGKLKNLGDTDVGFLDKKKFGAQRAWGESQGDVSSANKKRESTRKISSQAERQGNKVQKKKRKASQRVGSYQTGVAK